MNSNNDPRDFLHNSIVKAPFSRRDYMKTVFAKDNAEENSQWRLRQMQPIANEFCEEGVGDEEAREKQVS